MINYEPEPGIALVKLIPRYSGIKAPEKSYDSIMEGTIIAINDANKDKNYMIGRVGHWRQFKDDLRLADNYAAIELKDIFITDKE
jgi:hypothetical protein